MDEPTARYVEHISHDLWSIVKRCWAMGPLDRPTFDDLTTEFGALLTSTATHARRPLKGVLPAKYDPADDNRLVRRAFWGSFSGLFCSRGYGGVFNFTWRRFTCGSR